MADTDNKAPAANAAPANNDTANRRAAADRKATQNARTDAERRLDEENEARHAANMEAEERRNNSQPTPTQRENDLAKLGHDVAEKEDDGSGPEQPVVGQRGGAYLTRDVTK